MVLIKCPFLLAAQIIAKVAHEGLRPHVPRDCPWDSIMTSCWKQNPSERPEFQSILISLSKIFLKQRPSNVGAAVIVRHVSSDRDLAARVQGAGAGSDRSAHSKLLRANTPVEIPQTIAVVPENHNDDLNRSDESNSGKQSSSIYGKAGDDSFFRNFMSFSHKRSSPNTDEDSLDEDSEKSLLLSKKKKSYDNHTTPTPKPNPNLFFNAFKVNVGEPEERRKGLEDHLANISQTPRRSTNSTHNMNSWSLPPAASSTSPFEKFRSKTMEEDNYDAIWNNNNNESSPGYIFIHVH